MPTVILPATDVSAAAKAAIADRAPRPGFIKSETREDYVLLEIASAAEWLDDMEISNGTMGLTLQEAKLLEPYLPRYG